MSDINFELFPGKDLAGLFKDIYKNQESKKRRISELIYELKTAIRKSPLGVMDVSDIILIYPIIQDLVDSSVKNDDALIKMATVVQRIISAASKMEGDTGFLSDKEKQQLLQEVKDLSEDITGGEGVLENIDSELQRIKKEMDEDESEN